MKDEEEWHSEWTSVAQTEYKSFKSWGCLEIVITMIFDVEDEFTLSLQWVTIYSS